MEHAALSMGLSVQYPTEDPVMACPVRLTCKSHVVLLNMCRKQEEIPVNVGTSSIHGNDSPHLMQHCKVMIANKE
jgi:hypothetical protein